MKPPIKLALMAVLGMLAGTTTFAQISTGDEAPPPGPPPGRPGPERMGPETHRKVLLEKYDANKDGQLDEAELAKLGRDVYEGKLPPPRQGPAGPRAPGGFDRPGFDRPQPRGPSGFREGNFEPRDPRTGNPPRRHPGPMMDRGEFSRGGDHARPPFGPGSPDSGPSGLEERRKALDEHRRQFLKSYDLNGDGKLDSAEREAIGKDIEDGKLPPPPPQPERR